MDTAQTIDPMRRLDGKQSRLKRELMELEKRAGIWDAAKKAREGPPIPYGLFDIERKPLGAQEEQLERDLYQADQHDYIREETRRLYFGVEDLVLRKSLIEKERECDDVHRVIVEQFVHEANAQLLEARKVPEKPPWIAIVSIGGAAIGIGWTVFGIPGALAGLSAGYFLGYFRLVKLHARPRVAVSDAEWELQIAEAALAEWSEGGWRPETFSRDEATTGSPDEAFGKLSAMRLRLALEHDRTGSYRRA